MVKLFDFAQNALQQAGVPTGRNWRETKEIARRQTVAQLSRRNISTSTAVKWHGVGSIVGVSAQLRRKQA